jgi:hypothetical protein
MNYKLQYYREKTSILRLIFKNERTAESDDQHLGALNHKLANQALLRITPPPYLTLGNREYLETYCTTEDVTSADPRLRSTRQTAAFPQWIHHV